MSKFNIGDKVYYANYTPMGQKKFRVYDAIITEIHHLDGWNSYVTDKFNDNRCAEYTLFKTQEELTKYYVNMIGQEVEIDESNLGILEEGIKDLKQEIRSKKRILRMIPIRLSEEE